MDGGVKVPRSEDGQARQEPTHPETSFPKGEFSVDNVTLIRIVAGVLAVVVFVTLVFRMKKKGSR